MLSTINQQQLFKAIGYTPHSDAQWAFHRDNTRYKIPCCGRRFGKTTMAARYLLERLFIPDSYYWIVGPKYKLGEKEYRVLYRDIMIRMGLKGKVRASYNVKQGDMRMEFPWDTVLEVVSADNKDSLIGEGLDGAIISEAATHTPDIWEMYIQPALSDKEGWAIFPSTPRGYNWYQGLWKLGQDPDYEEYKSWRFPSWENKAVFPGGRNDPKIKNIERVASKHHFLQEYGAEFTTFEGKIYDEFNPNIHVRNITYNPAWRNYWVFDYGYSAPFVCLDIMVDPSDNVYVWREYQVRYLSTWEHAQTLKDRSNPDGFHVDGLHGDPRGADEAATVALILGYVFREDVAWTTGIECVKRWLKLQPDGKPKLYIDPSCVDLIRQMDRLRTPDVKPGEKNPKEGQHDYDDHGPDALRYFMGQYFVLGANAHLSDVYSDSRPSTEADTFFTLHTQIIDDDKVPW
jgi:hypothetical protein